MWLGIGFILGGALIALIIWLINRKVKVTWYEWLIGAIGFALLVFTIQNFFGSFTELEQTAAWMFLLVTGLPALVLIVVAWQLAWRRHRTA